MRVHFINLDRSKDRLDEFRNINRHLREPVRFPAIDGRGLDIASLARRGLVTEDVLSTYRIGAIGCAMSNIALWDTAIDTGQPLTICDDDAILHRQFELHSEQVIRTLPPEWDLVLWGWNFDSFSCFEMLPGISDCLAFFEQDRMIPNVEAFQSRPLSPRAYRLVWAWGHPCYTVSPKGARVLKNKLLPFRPMSIPCPEGFKGRPCPPSFTVTGMDGALNGIYRQLSAFVCFPPLVVTKNQHVASTIQTPLPDQQRRPEGTHAGQEATRSGDVVALNKLATELQKANRLEEALSKYNKALSLKPDDVALLSNRGTVLIDLSRFEDALSNYDKLLSIRTNNFEALSMRGLALENLGRLEEALADYDKAIALEPRSAETLYNRGNVLSDLSRFEEALASFGRALHITPDFIPALKNTALILEDLKRFDEALASYDKVLAIRPDDFYALYLRGLILENLKRSPEALASYDNAISLNPGSIEALYNRGNVLADLARFEEALKSYDKALQINPGVPAILNNRGLVLEELNRFSEALASYDKALKIKPDYDAASENRKLVLNQLERSPAT